MKLLLELMVHDTAEPTAGPCEPPTWEVAQTHYVASLTAAHTLGLAMLDEAKEEHPEAWVAVTSCVREYDDEGVIHWVKARGMSQVRTRIAQEGALRAAVA